MNIIIPAFDCKRFCVKKLSSKPTTVPAVHIDLAKILNVKKRKIHKYMQMY